MSEANTEVLLSQLLEELVSCIDDVEEKKYVRRTFLLYGLGYIEENAFDHEFRLWSRSLPAKILKAVRKHIEKKFQSVTLIVLDHKLFGTSLATALHDRVAFDGVDVGADLDYLDEHVDLGALEHQDCLHGEEYLDSYILGKRVDGAALIETESKFGSALERMLKHYNSPRNNNHIRQVMVKFAIGLISKEQWEEDMRLHKRMISASYFDAVTRQMTDQLLELFNDVLLFGVTPEAAVEKRRRVQIADWIYINQVIKVSEVTEDQLVYAADIKLKDKCPMDGDPMMPKDGPLL